MLFLAANARVMSSNGGQNQVFVNLYHWKTEPVYFKEPKRRNFLTNIQRENGTHGHLCIFYFLFFFCGFLFFLFWHENWSYTWWSSLSIVTSLFVKLIWLETSLLKVGIARTSVDTRETCPPFPTFFETMGLLIYWMISQNLSASKIK